MVSIYGAMTAERKSRIWELWRKGTPMSSPIEAEICALIEYPTRYTAC